MQQLVRDRLPLIVRIVGQERFAEPNDRILPALDRAARRQRLRVLGGIFRDIDPPVPQMQGIGELAEHTVPTAAVGSAASAWSVQARRVRPRPGSAACGPDVVLDVAGPCHVDAAGLFDPVGIVADMVDPKRRVDLRHNPDLPAAGRKRRSPRTRYRVSPSSVTIIGWKNGQAYRSAIRQHGSSSCLAMCLQDRRLDPQEPGTDFLDRVRPAAQSPNLTESMPSSKWTLSWPLPSFLAA